MCNINRYNGVLYSVFLASKVYVVLVLNTYILEARLVHPSLMVVKESYHEKNDFCK